MKGTKVIFLTLAFVAPIAVFIFLKFFGKNEFRVEPLFQTEVPVINSCSEIRAPYRIDDLVKYQISLMDSLTLVYFDQSKETTNTIARIREEFRNSSISLVPANKVFYDSTVQEIKSCVYLLTDPMNAALVDKVGLIRGQYNLMDLDEADRLIVELKILLKQY